MIHGYGANAPDLYPLAGVLTSPRIKNWYFPNGILDAPGVPNGRAWFPLDVQALEKALQTGEFRDFSPLPKGLEVAHERLCGFMEAAGLNPATTLIGGFSQGAMLATHTSLKSKVDFLGLMILSGTMIAEELWRSLIPQKKLSFFQSHGTSDPLLPYNRAEMLNQLMQENDWHGDFVSFRGGHEIPPNVVSQLQKFVHGF